MSYTRRVIQVKFEGAVNETVTGLRTYAHITLANTPSPGTLVLKIQGLPLSIINSLCRCGTTWTLPASKTTITVSAGDSNGLTTVFKGTPVYAFPSFNEQPDVSFVINANNTYPLQIEPAKPTSLQGSVPVDDGLRQILTPIGASVVNNGVNALLSNPYFYGSTWSQCKAAVRAADCGGYYDAVTNTFTVWPKQGSTSQGGPILIAPETGLIGYPDFMQNQVVARVLFSGNVFTSPSQKIQIKSQLASASGIFTAWGVEHDLSSETPNGPWMTTITAQPDKIG